MDFTLYENRNAPNSGSISNRPMSSVLNKTGSLPHFKTKNQKYITLIF